MRFFQIFNPLWAEAAAQGQSFVQVFNANGQKFRNMGDSHTHTHTHIYIYNTVFQKLGEYFTNSKTQRFLVFTFN